MDAARTFSTRDAARILHVPEPRVRTWARMGGIVPKPGLGGTLEFTFQELLLLRTTRGLLEAGVPARRVKRIWSTLKRQLSEGLPLSSIRIRAEGDHAIAWDGKTPWQPDSGQILLDFAPPEGGDVESEGEEEIPGLIAAVPREEALGPRRTTIEEKPGLDEVPPPAEARIFAFPGPMAARPGSRSRAEVESEDSAEVTDHWFQIGSDLETSSPLEAREAYLKALDADPNYADAHTNLGRLEHRSGDLAAAEARYRRALQCAPADPTAHFNLGVLLEDRNCPQAAIESYEQAIAHDPEFADAHYNLGLLLEKLGRRADALRHLMTAHHLYAQ